MSGLRTLAELDLRQVWQGVAARAVHGNQLTLAVVELEPDSVVPEHSHDHEQLGLVLHGTLTFRIGDETRELSAGGTWEIPSNVPHEVHAGPDGAVVIDAFAPPRDDWRDRDRLDRRPRWPAA